MTNDTATNSTHRRRRLYAQPRALFAVWLAAVGAALLGSGHLWPVVAKLVEASIYVGAIAAIASYTPIRSRFDQLPRGSRMFVGMLLALLIAGQLSGRKWSTYPLSNWSMYSRPQTTSQFKYLRVEARLADGRLIELRPTELLPSLAHDRFRTKLIQLCRADLVQPNTSGEDSELTRTLAALAELYNRRHAANPVRSTCVYLYETDVATYRAAQPIERKLVAYVRTVAE